MKYTYEDYLDGVCTRTEYRNQFNPPKLELNKTYVQAKKTWHERHYLIIFIDNNIALGKCIYNVISDKFIGDYSLFNVNDGWSYDNSNDVYRLELIE